MTTVYTTREEWLTAAVREFRGLFKSAAGVDIPAVRVSVGWPGGRGDKSNVIGQCWSGTAAADGVAQIFITPRLADPARVLDVLAHELVHAVDGNQSGHRGEFARIAKAVGLEGPMTATVAGDAFKAEAAAIIGTIGDYPHAALSDADDAAEGPKKQGTRMIKVVCPESGYVLRTTRKWLAEYGAPFCPCHREMMSIDL